MPYFDYIQDEKPAAKPTPCNQSALIKALGAVTKLDLIFWAAITQSTVWAASTRPNSTTFSLIWLVVAITVGVFELAARLRKAPNAELRPTE